MIVNIDDSWLVAAAAAFLIAALFLARTIRSLIRILRGSVVASLPVHTEQTIPLPRAGIFDLYVEGKRFSRDFGALDFGLSDASGAPVPLQRILFRTTVSGASRVRLLLRRFTVLSAGTFTLRINGIKQDQDPENRIVFATPVTARLVLHILAIVALAMPAMASLGGAVFLLLSRP